MWNKKSRINAEQKVLMKKLQTEKFKGGGAPQTNVSAKRSLQNKKCRTKNVKQKCRTKGVEQKFAEQKIQRWWGTMQTNVSAKRSL